MPHLGFSVHLRALQMQVFPKQVEKNALWMIDEIKRAEKGNIEIVAFPELSLSGYFLGDLWQQKDFLQECDYWKEKIIASTKDYNLIVAFGCPIIDWQKTRGRWLCS